MAKNYSLADAPPEVEVCDATLCDLQPGHSSIPIVLRLLNAWHPSSQLPGDFFPPLYTLWLDEQANMIEGLTEPQDSDSILNNFSIGSLYKLPTTVTIVRRAIGATCSHQCRLLIKPDQQFLKIYEDPEIPFFPRIGFESAPFTSLQQYEDALPKYPDILGRMVSITLPAETTTNQVTFSVVLIDCRIPSCLPSSMFPYPTHSGTELQVDYLGPYLEEFALENLAASERLGPLICCFTSMHIQLPKVSGPILATPSDATRAFVGDYSYPFRSIFERFMHENLPIRLNPSPFEEKFKFVRGELPPQTNIAKLMRKAGDDLLPYDTPFWCIFRIDSLLPGHRPYVIENGACRYQVPIRVHDATNHTNFVIDHDAATSLFKLPITDFIRLTPPQKVAVLASMQTKCFTAEVSFLSPGHKYVGNFVVSTLWDELATSLQ